MPGLADFLIAAGAVSRQQVEEARAAQRAAGGSLFRHLVRLGFVSDARLADLLASHFELPRVDLDSQAPDPEVAALVPEALARRHGLLPLSRQGARLVVAMANPTDLLGLDEVRLLTGLEIEPAIATEGEIRRALDRWYEATSGGRFHDLTEEVLGEDGDDDFEARSGLEDQPLVLDLEDERPPWPEVAAEAEASLSPAALDELPGATQPGTVVGEVFLDLDAPDEQAPFESLATDGPSRTPTSGSRAAPVDRVDFSIFAPDVVPPGASFLLEVWASLREQRGEMLEQATRRGRLVERGSRGRIAVTSESEIALHLRLDGFEVEQPLESLWWDGEIVNVAFLVTAPADLAGGAYPGLIEVLNGGLRLARLHFEVLVGPGVPRTGRLDVERTAVRSALASYASEDRAEVLRRVQGISAAGIDVFVDVLSLRAGEDWEQSLLDNIRRRDTFYLFWSPAASRSRWVEREWRCALEVRGLDFIHPVPLADPGEAPPPHELASRHFNDLILACLQNQREGRLSPLS